MDKITLKNFRCFREEQTARLAPLTLLVGENSTGKTSFMALIRALWDVAFAERVPDFREPPYNLGSFRDIVHNRGGRGKPAESFEAGFEYSVSHRMGPIAFKSTFEWYDANPYPSTRFLKVYENWIKARELKNGKHLVEQGIVNGESCDSNEVTYSYVRDETQLASLSLLKYLADLESERPRNSGLLNLLALESRPFAGAPIRSRPIRTYDPARPWSDPEGANAPTYLASLYQRDPDGWQLLKAKLEAFGQASGLFDEISVKSFGKTEGTPFQLEIRKFSSNSRRKGPQRNLIDVGYGVSQALPLITELLKADAPQVFLLQQPEVHLHPRAQAALGSLFCELAAPERQLIVETHSDYLIDRVRMDVRDKTTGLKPEDVSILYFEHGDLDVKIHTIRLDELGNVLDAPPSYGKFFMEETRRSIGIGL